jgi:hypothetical protein
VLALVFRPGVYPPFDEAVGYVNIAKSLGRWVPSYYAGRVLHPLVVRFVAGVFHVPIDARLFIWVSAAALIVVFASLGVYNGLEFPSSPALWLLLAVTATIVDQYRNYYWHDLFYAALCALFFLALRAKWWLSLPLVFLLYVTRESTLVLVVALVAIGAFRRQWAFCFSALVVGLAGMGVESTIVARAAPDQHRIPMFLLDALKVPYNFLLNFCGLEFWTNTIAATTGPPKWIANVPAWIHLGNIHQVGFVDFSWERPARTLLVLSTAFGILPLVVIRAARGPARLLLRRLDLVTACVYGGLMFLLAPLQGTTPARYILYAWPLFWLFGVAALEAGRTSRRRRIEIVVASLCAAWTPAVVRLITGPTLQGPGSLSEVSRKGLLISLTLVVAIYIYGWRLAKPVAPAAD